MSTLEDIPNGTKSQTLQNQLRSKRYVVLCLMRHNI